MADVQYASSAMPSYFPHPSWHPMYSLARDAVESVLKLRAADVNWQWQLFCAGFMFIVTILHTYCTSIETIYHENRSEIHYTALPL